MLLSGNLCRLGTLALRQATTKTPQTTTTATSLTHTFTRGARTRATRFRARTVEKVKKPAGFYAENSGRILVGGACVGGLGALCFYGLGLSNESGAIDEARFWPAAVRSSIKSTYLYFAGSLGVTAGAAYSLCRSQAIYRLMNANPWLVFGGSMVAMIGSSMACRALPYEQGVNAKHFAWLLHSGVVGCVIAPMCLMGGPLVMRAATYTAGAVGALSLTAACAPNEKFLTWGGPLSLCLGGVFIAAIGGMFVPATSAAAPILNSVVTYGGLVVFGGFMLYDTQKIIKRAQVDYYAGRRYDPINGSIGIYMDTINIFIRILMLLQNSNRRK